MERIQVEELINFKMLPFDIFNENNIDFKQVFTSELSMSFIVENKDNVLANLVNIVTSEYYNVFHSLSLYVINGHEVSSLLKKEWIDSIKADIINLIYNDKLSKDDKILSFNNKLDIKFQSYITYILNNILK